MEMYKRVAIPLSDADPSLVIMKNEYPHCVHHGAMNSVSRFIKNNKAYLIWRCVSTYHKPPDIEIGHRKPQISGIKENACLAGCVTNSKLRNEP